VKSPRFLIVITLSLAALLLAAPPDPVAWKLDGAPAAAVKAGARFNVKLVARIQQGWHMYSMKPVDDGPVPTRVWVTEGQPFKLAGAVKADAPETVQDAALNMEVELYHGGASFVLPVEVAAGAPAGPQTLSVSASYQTCNNSICLPPKTIKVEVPVAIAK
jgi:DsbC/DsbD-like thiol-disulfide interchange protein